MVNHVGKTNTVLNKQLGYTNHFTSSDDITVIAGEIGTGMLIFDPEGTLGVITAFLSGHDFTITTHALSIDIQTILSLEY